MFQLEVHQDGNIFNIETKGGDCLLQILQSEGFEIYSPCGGNGTCGKCLVWTKGDGLITSCVYEVMRNMTIIIPDKREEKILVAQHELTIELPFHPGPSTELSTYPHGVAIDIGTTSLVFYLVNLITGALVETRAMGNPQTKYGSDVITRIDYSVRNEGGLKVLQNTLIQSINSQLTHFIDLLEIKSRDLVKVSITGNTTMLHLLLGIDPLPIALAPFTPRFTDAQILKTNSLGLYCNQEAEIKTLPCISAYVGADIVAGLASIKHTGKNMTYLFMDIGTNGELALVTSEDVLCCATAAGPAFEGARITHGMLAVEGAISSFGPGGYTVIGDGLPIGMCGSGLIDVIAYLLDQGLIEKDGLIDGPFVIAENDQFDSRVSIVLYQQDIREVQLAKSAIAAGVHILMKKANVSHHEIDAVYLAGGFGNYINVESAIKIGLISPLFQGKIIPLGNTSGTGATLALRSSAFMEVTEALRMKATYIELSEENDFAMEFAMNMMFDQANNT